MVISKALHQFYIDNNLPTKGGKNDNWFYLHFKFFSIKLPNSNFRKKVIHVHDIQHILYNCDTSWKGEAFISGYEIASGMWKHLPIGFMSLWAMGFTFLNYPKEVLKGFKAGAKSKNLLDFNIDKSDLLKLTKTEVFEILAKKDNFSWFSFIFWSILSLIAFFFPLIILLLFLIL